MKLKEIYIAQWSKKEQKDFMNEILEEYNECFKPIVEEWLKQELDEPYKVQPKETTIRELLEELKEK